MQFTYSLRDNLVGVTPVSGPFYTECLEFEIFRAYIQYQDCLCGLVVHRTTVLKVWSVNACSFSLLKLCNNTTHKFLLFNYYENPKTFGKRVLYTKCVFNFLLCLWNLFFCPLHIYSRFMQKCMCESSCGVYVIV